MDLSLIFFIILPNVSLAGSILLLVMGIVNLLKKENAEIIFV